MPNEHEPVFTRAVSNSDFESALSKLTNPADIATLCRDTFPESRTVGRDGEVIPDRIGQPASAPEPAPSSKTEQFYEVIYPCGNDRYEVCAHSQEELDEKKRRILSLYQR